MKALQRVLWSLHMVGAEEQGIQVRQVSEKELYPIHRVKNDSRWRRMRAFELYEWSLNGKKQPGQGPKLF